ncbi:MAG: penicillin-binding protein activator LpoB [Bacteroidales bacterium]|nr:penicillin-binding protein activator LpoB [Bacteroidales bacterium]MCF8455448.1 penicillin-binding protein activator LpoB [Bacteroidales bacterium]
MKKTTLFTCVIIGLLSFSACTTTRTVDRVSPDQQIDLSGRWNDSDSKLTAEALVEQLLQQTWIDKFKQAHNGEAPVVVVGLVKNKSHEHISAETFIKDLEKAIVKSGRARLVQAGDKREELRGERADQQEFASASTTKKWGQELGADFMLQGTINSIVDSYKNEKVVYYQIDLELSNLETNEMVWMGDKKIKKVVTN